LSYIYSVGDYFCPVLSYIYFVGDSFCPVLQIFPFLKFRTISFLWPQIFCWIYTGKKFWKPHANRGLWASWKVARRAEVFIFAGSAFSEDTRLPQITKQDRSKSS
jgi:hypothetical protein